MFGRLIFVLLPYALVIGCLVALGVAATVIAKGAETSPTDTPLASVTKTSPSADWLHVTDAGLYMPGVVMDTKRNKYTRKEKPKAYYVPLMTAEEAFKASASTAPPATRVYAKFSPTEFESKYPGFSFDSPTGMSAFEPLDINGTRSGSFSLSSQFKTYLQDELRIDPATVTLIDFDNHPMQRSEAVGLSIGSVIVAAGSVFWIKKRWQQPIAA